MIDIYNLRIYELRDYARIVGVQAPTTKVREQLINEIEAINAGKQQPINAVSSKGRKQSNPIVVEEKTKMSLNNELNSLKDELCKRIDTLCEKINK